MISGEPRQPAKRLRERLGELREAHAPHLIDLEVLSALARWVRGSRLSLGQAERLLGRFHELRIIRHPHHPFLGHIWALRGNLSPYDASYVILAEALDLPLLTHDKGMAAAPTKAQVELVPA